MGDDAPLKPATLLRSRHAVGDEVVWVEVRGNADWVHGVEIDTEPGRLETLGAVAPRGPLGRRVARQLAAYFRDAAPFELPLWAHGGDSPAQLEAIDFLRKIPCGQTRSYAQQARAVRERMGSKGVPSGFNPRNAGTANHNNHYPLVIPCHRVVRGDGGMGGFMGSGRSAALRLKGALLRHETRCAHKARA